MERILNDEEKIRRAEEIYSRRNNRNINLYDRNNNSKKRYIGSKIGFQILILLNLTIIIFCLQNRNYIFKEEFIEKIMLYEDKLNLKINSLINYQNDETLDMNDNIGSDANIENTILQDKANNEESKMVNPEEKKDEIVPNNEVVSSMSQMDIDVQNLKASYHLINPLEKGIVSSGFGSRESEYQNVKGYHTGIDLAAEKGTKIKSSFNGIVSLVSSEGDYGKHLKVRCNNVTLLYAHCSKILVKEGEMVSEGQEIAEVGSTGNSTGPHLHFEIRVDDRFVDPKKILNF